MSALAEITIAFFPLVSASSLRDGFQEVKSVAVSKEPVKMTALTPT
jgi:hypothetical protein